MSSLKLSEPPPYEVVDLDSPFLFGIARKMNEREKAEAIDHGVTDDRPMSILGVSHEGLAGVMGKDVVTLFAAAPLLLDALLAQEEAERAEDELLSHLGGMGVAKSKAAEAAERAKADELGRIAREASEKARDLRAAALAATNPASEP